MGNSSQTIQAVVDSVAAIGDLNPVFTATGGMASEPALTIANDVFGEMIAERFPWKWNRRKIPPFITQSQQQDYASLGIYNIGWLENGNRVQLNSTQVPPPVWPITVVRDLRVSRMPAGWPTMACWFPNDQLEQGEWPGPNVVYTDPINLTTMPANPWTNILDAEGNILVLTKYGITGVVPPVAPPWTDPSAEEPDNYPVGVVITDGTCEWTVADPSGQGIRLYPPPPTTSASIWLIRLYAQKKPPIITQLQQKLDPLPDDYLKWFRDGFIAYAHRYSSNPNVLKRYPMMKTEWLNAMAAAAKQGDREDEAKGFYPATGLLSPEYYSDPGPGNPYWRQWGGS
jgi:hypothetical protein